MGRRALRAVDPQLDLSSFLYPLAEVPQPFAADSFFGRPAPLEIEVGSGKGLFLQSACEAFPQRNFLGIEMARKYARFSAARLARRELTNGKMISGDGLRFFHEWLPDRVADAVHVYFPDPWWKARHKKRRVLNAAFLVDVQRVLAPGGLLHFWTDVQEYFDTTLDLIAATVQLEGPMAVAEASPEHDLDYRTHFERRTRLHGEPVYRAQFRRPG